MIQNIKVDIVYFMAATDFEFEFNLGSCCHMRLLNDKAKDKNSFVNSLARAVSRSQIIICVGPLFGDGGLIATAAAAISHSLEKADNKAYGIAAEEPVDIIAGSVPLVTPEGYFGGCIIESGKQSIILLSENRTIRKSIMKTLVHPYIEDISVMQSTKQVTLNKADMEIPLEEVAPVTLQEETEPETEPVIEPEIELEAQSPEEPETETIEPEIQTTVETEPEAVSQVEEEQETEEEPELAETKEEHNIFFDFSKEDEDEIKDEPEETVEEIETDEEKIIEDAFIQDDDYEKQKKQRKGINISILIISFVLTLAILALCYFLVYLPMQKGVSTIEYFKQIFSTVSETGSV